MGKFDNLPKPGAGFRMSGTPGSFQRKFSSATRFGTAKNLTDNAKAIYNEMAKRVPALRRRGGLSWQERRNSYFNVIKADKKLTADDKRDLKEMFEAYAKKDSAEAKKIQSKLKKEKKVVPIGRRALDTSVADDILGAAPMRGFSQAVGGSSISARNAGQGTIYSNNRGGGFALTKKGTASAIKNKPSEPRNLRPVL